MEDLIKALQIFLKYGNISYPTHCEHDVMYITTEWDIVSDEDKVELDTLGFHQSDIHDGFKSYRFGSA